MREAAEAGGRTEENGTLANALRFVDTDILEHGGDEDEQEGVKIDDDDQPACDGQTVPFPNFLDSASDAYGEDSERHERENHLEQASAGRARELLRAVARK